MPPFSKLSVDVTGRLLSALIAMHVAGKLRRRLGRLIMDVELDYRLQDRIVNGFMRFEGGRAIVTVLDHSPAPTEIANFAELCEAQLIDEAWLVAPDVTAKVQRLRPRVLGQNRVIVPTLRVVPLSEFVMEVAGEFNLSLRTDAGSLSVEIAPKVEAG